MANRYQHTEERGCKLHPKKVQSLQGKYTDVAVLFCSTHNKEVCQGDGYEWGKHPAYKPVLLKS